MSLSASIISPMQALSSQCVDTTVAEAGGLKITPEASVPLLKLSDLGYIMGLKFN